MTSYICCWFRLSISHPLSTGITSVSLHFTCHHQSIGFYISSLFNFIMVEDRLSRIDNPWKRASPQYNAIISSRYYNTDFDYPNYVILQQLSPIKQVHIYDAIIHFSTTLLSYTKHALLWGWCVHLIKSLHMHGGESSTKFLQLEERNDTGNIWARS